jgi:AcrR family transcriptional regulator
MTSRPTQTRPGYHHGNLNEALLEAAIALIEEKGVDTLSVREVAKRAQVSPGAPFRHFSNKTALLTAVAEQAMFRLTREVRRELEKTGDDDPVESLRAIGRGYLQWAQANPTHFQVISSRSLIDFHGSEKLVEENEAIRVIMVSLIERARQEGRLRGEMAADTLVFSCRAFIYGVARMWIDGHFKEWKVERAAPDAMADALDLFIALIGAKQSPPAG